VDSRIDAASQQHVIEQLPAPWWGAGPACEQVDRGDQMDEQASAGGGKAIASLVLGIFGLVAWFCPIIGLPVTIVGMALGITDLKSAYRGIAITGVVLCVIGLVFSTLNAAVGVYLVATARHPLFRRPADAIEWSNEPLPPAGGSDPYRISTEEDGVLGPLTVRVPKVNLLNVEATYSLPGFDGQFTKEEIETLKANPAVKNLDDAIKVLAAQRDKVVDEFLLELLAEGPQAEHEIIGAGSSVPTPGSAGIPPNELHEARERLGIIRTKAMDWELPKMEAGPDPEESGDESTP
jgi:hypothetical protein